MSNNDAIADLVLRQEVPIAVKVVLLVVLLCATILFAFDERWGDSIRHLAAIPFQRFNWQSEQFLGNPVIRITSLLLSSLTIAAFIFAYNLGEHYNYENSSFIDFIKILVVVLLFSTVKFGFNYSYFRLHKSSGVGSQLTDFHFSINQILSLVLGTLLLVDVFYNRLHGNFFYFLVGIGSLFFLIRLYGTILLLQNNFRYPILTLFVYLCTVEIVPTLIVAKILFVNS